MCTWRPSTAYHPPGLKRVFFPLLPNTLHGARGRAGDSIEDQAADGGEDVRNRNQGGHETTRRRGEA